MVTDTKKEPKAKGRPKASGAALEGAVVEASKAEAVEATEKVKMVEPGPAEVELVLKQQIGYLGVGSVIRVSAEAAKEYIASGRAVRRA